MALFFECTQESARIVLDTADIVRDGDLSSAMLADYEASFTAALDLPTIKMFYLAKPQYWC